MAILNEVFLMDTLVINYGMTEAQADYLLSLEIPCTLFKGEILYTAKDLEKAKEVAPKDFAKNICHTNAYPEIQKKAYLLWGYELAEFKLDYLEQNDQKIKGKELYLLNPIGALSYILVGADITLDSIEKNYQSIEQEWNVEEEYMEEEEERDPFKPSVRIIDEKDVLILEALESFNRLLSLIEKRFAA